MTDSTKSLRSARWYAANDLRSFGHRSRTLQMGYSYDDFMGKPVVAIINTWSDINQCHAHFRVRAEEVKRGVWQAGGFPIELPAMSLSEPFVKPSTMLYRNLLALEVEELLRSHPVDGVVLMGGCDKTTPATLMGAISMNLPAIFMPAGPMLRGNYHGKPLGSGSDVWKYWADKQAGAVSETEWRDMEAGIARSFGTCMTMGTAATMMSLAETLGMTLTGASSIPAAELEPSADGERHRPAHRRDDRRGFEAARRALPRLLPQRAGRADGARRLDQRDDPSRRHGGARRGAARPRRFRPGRA